MCIYPRSVCIQYNLPPLCGSLLSTYERTYPVSVFPLFILQTTTILFPNKGTKPAKYLRKHGFRDSCFYETNCQQVCVLWRSTRLNFIIPDRCPPNILNKRTQSQEKYQRGLFVMHPDDLWHHPVEAVVGLTSSFAHTSSLSQQKKRWNSLSNDAADQGSRSPQWAFGLATLKKNSISAVSNASFSLDHQFSTENNHPLLTMNRRVWGNII